MEKNKRKSALVYPFLFIFRRLVFTATIVFMVHFTWLQISVQITSSMTLAVYFVSVWPFESVKLTKLEIFNELAAVIMCYFTLSFTDWVPYARTRYDIGWAFIAVTCLHLATHLALLIYETFTNAKIKAR